MHHVKMTDRVVRVTATGPDYGALEPAALQLGGQAFLATQGEDAQWTTPSGKRLVAKRITDVVPFSSIRDARNITHVLSWEADFYVGPAEEWTT
jgi:hypothetical protein